MSCTENESGPFVVFFLPAVVGCLTILLARRWANSQVSNTSSNAVSRRRKINKDPHIKRPLPPFATKMVGPTSKRTQALNKKGGFPVLDEDVSNGKRVKSNLRVTVASSGPVAEVKLEEGPVPPKHVPFPYIPQDGELLYESMTFIFTLVATGLQYLNLYRTVWWLPHSNTSQAMHFHLIDLHLVAFIVTLLLRRLLLSLTLVLLRAVLAPKYIPQATVAARMFILGIVLGALTWFSYFIVMRYPLVKIFYLFYPAVIYFLLFGFQSSPFLELSNSECPPLHCCSQDPGHIRAEVDVLRQDFNLRLKKILFNSVLGAYYSSFIPCCLVHPHVYYSVYAASQQVAFVWGALFCRGAQYQVSAGVCDVPHRAALHLGRWTTLHTGVDDNDVPVWSPDKLWSRGARVVHRETLYVAQSASVAAEPALSHHLRFHAVFVNPSTLLCLLLCLQLSLIVLQLCLMFSSIAWHYFVSIIVLLFINYYTLFKLVRDYLVAFKVYKTEHLIQDKNQAT